MAAPRAWMPYFHAAFSFGAVLGAGSVALAAWQGVGLVQPPVLAAVVAVVGTQRFVRESHADAPSPGPPAGAGPGGPGAPHTPGVPPAARPGEVLIGLVCLGAALAEGAATDWLVLLLVDVQGTPAAFGTLALTAVNVTMTLGRILGGPAIDRFGRDTVVRVGAGRVRHLPGGGVGRR